MACCLTCSRMVVIIVNSLFLIIGFVLFAGGIFIRFGEPIIEDYMSGFEEAIESTLRNAGFSTTDIDLDYVALLLGVYLTLIFVGLFLMFVTIMGCCGSCYKIKCMLVLYVVICSLLLIGEGVGAGIAYGSPKTIKDPLKRKFKDDIQSDFAGINGTDLVSVAWNHAMRTVQCCGVDSYADFTGATNWATDYTGKSPPITLKTPIACCKQLPGNDDFTCAGPAASSTDNYLDKGCFDEVWDITVGNVVLTAAVLGSIAVVQLMLISFAIVILCSGGDAKKAKKNRVRPADQRGMKGTGQPADHVRRRNNPKLMQYRK